VLVVRAANVAEAQARLADALDEMTKRWRLDEITASAGKPSQISYLVRLRKSTSKDVLLTAVHTRAGDSIVGADMQLAEDTRVEAGARA
jgi:hypothetical protein